MLGQVGQDLLSWVLKLKLLTQRNRTVGHFPGSNSRGSSQRQLLILVTVPGVQ